MLDHRKKTFLRRSFHHEYGRNARPLQNKHSYAERAMLGQDDIADKKTATAECGAVLEASGGQFTGCSLTNPAAIRSATKASTPASARTEDPL
jgi:hypothetical protein